MLCLAGIYNTKDAGSAESEIESGKALFDQRSCAVCHDPTEDQRRDGLGPSWKQIVEAYEGSDEGLNNFLKGQGDPIVDKTKFPMMHGQIILLKTCSDSEIRALEKFIMEQALSSNKK